jgi:hypothetical protein
MDTNQMGVGFPKAVLGYKAMGNLGIGVRVCCECDRSGDAVRWAAPLPVTHGYCPSCATRMIAKVTGDAEQSRLDEYSRPWRVWNCAGDYAGAQR